MLLFLTFSAFVVCSCLGDESNTRRLRKFFDGDQYDVTCFELVGDPKVTAVAERLQIWARANFDLVRRLVEENDGRPLPYHESMGNSGISRQEYVGFLKNSKSSMQIREVGETLSYTVSRKNDIVSLVPKDGATSTSKLAPKTIPYALNLMLTSTQVDLTNTHLKLLNIDAGKANWTTGESEMLGEYRGFEWRLDDDRLLDFANLPEGEVAANVVVSMFYSAKQRRSYCKYSVATGDRDGIHVNTQLTFWLSVSTSAK